jgi:ubiquinone/menaquinone biosynthesis C-methylase UbiE
MKNTWNDRADKYDEWYQTFQGAVENDVDWELLKKYLPENKKARILDAAGGTGRISLPLAEMGYSLTLCDISPAMLAVAKQKMLTQGVLDKVKIAQCGVRHLPFADESFDFALCWDGMIEAIKEFSRVIKRGGRISVFLVNKWAACIDNFYKNPDDTLASIDSPQGYLEDEEEKYRVVSTEEVADLFSAEGIKVLDIYAVCGWMDLLRIPKEVCESRSWDETFFGQTTQMVLKLSQEPSVKGMSRHLVLYGEKV